MKAYSLALTGLLCFSAQALALASGEVVSAEATKRNVYVSDGMIAGGDALANPVSLSSVRWAKNPAGYERIVVDLQGEGAGWESKVPPYFQVGHDSRSSSVNLSIRGVSARHLNNQALTRALGRSALVSQAYLAPGLEGDLAALEFRTRAPVDVESFYLLNPPRIVIDVRSKR